MLNDDSFSAEEKRREVQNVWNAPDQKTSESCNRNGNDAENDARRVEPH